MRWRSPLSTQRRCSAPPRKPRARGKGTLVTFSPKVFIPLTKLCRDVCHYCTFAGPPRRGERAYLTHEEVLEIARAGAAAGCHEALFTLGDKPERRYRGARTSCVARVRDDDRVPGAGLRARARGNRPTAASEPRPDGRGEELRCSRASLGFQGIMLETSPTGCRRGGAPTSACRTSFPRPSRHPGLGRTRSRAVHDRDPDRHR